MASKPSLTENSPEAGAARELLRRPSGGSTPGTYMGKKLLEVHFEWTIKIITLSAVTPF